MSVIESTVDGRYQVINRIATGGMGEVYRAHDAVLAREVALKVLHPHLAGDRGFVDRFRREARAAAILNHPNIVGVYDWGLTDGTYFMIMEFVRGLNARTLLSEVRRLEPAQVVEVALPVLAALEHAHGHGIVHRDVKPENILISEDGTVKVADFGLARAYADSYVSQAEGTVTGTVQYLAPEQIQGRPADPRTDLYALGVVMFELLTGGAPFSGETSLAIAYQHLSGSVPPPSAMAPMSTPALDGVVLAATAKDPTQRPPSARAMGEQVSRAAVGLPEETPLRRLVAGIPSTEIDTPDRAPTVSIPRVAAPGRRRARIAGWIVGILALLGVLAGGGYAAWTYVVPHYVTVPNVRARSIDDAGARLKARGLGVRISTSSEYSATVKQNLVLRTIPQAGARARKRSTVLLILSAGPEYLPVPNVLGKDQATAQDVVRRAGFVPSLNLAYSADVPKGLVIDQNPQPNTNVQKGSPVTLDVSRGPPPVTIPPNLVGQPRSEATNTLTGLGLKVDTAETFSTKIPAGDVAKVHPPGGRSVPAGSTVTLTISRGPRAFAMPDVRGESKEQAVADLEKKGLKVTVVPVPSIVPPDTVVFQDPQPGTTVQQGATVTIYVTGTQ